MLTSNTHPTWSEVSEIVGEHFTESWFKADSLTIYKRDGVGYGLIGLYSSVDETYIASSMTDPSIPFSLPMVRDLMKLSSRTQITFITEIKRFHDKVKVGLEPHGFIFAIMGDIMYSRNNYKGRNDEFDKKVS